MAIHNVLIVDDSPTERYYLSDILIRQGYSVSTAETGEEAMLKIRASKPDLILMDVVMPGANGFQVTRSIARDPELKDVPVIICSSKNQETDKIWGLRQGACAYLVKPVAAGDLLARIAELG
ncbi:response regulator transcription factor [Duganella qianjiadongensis]|uniref:Response regulator n=1 Tax=Duganella qianjiadongensis TaxID=2692176 RepID=A0ABW9VLI4_9BURK|nr:response regulator [Duganella qianjiadongensis]MYM40355.1 response regulator [Duganella qianjiadongensis]